MTAAQPADLFDAARRETASARFVLRADGVLHGVALPVEQTLTQARENLRCARELLDGRRVPFILDMCASGGMPQAVKGYYVSKGSTYFTAVAVVADTMLSRVQANLLVATFTLAGVQPPVSMFRSMEEALAWVHTQGNTQLSSA
jgi:hypothetical protein